MLLVYQLKVGLCLIAFYLLWKLLLSRETLHRFNRVLLLTVTILAFVLPWVKLTLNQSSAVSDGIIDIEGLLAIGSIEADSQSAATWNLIGFAYIIYMIGMVVLLLWHIYNGWNLRRLLRQGTTERMPNGDRLHVMAAVDIAPFSYFRHIVISEHDMHEASEQILTHEQAHIRLGHSYDVLFMDVVLLFQWWNPAAWLLRGELKQVHEYEADEAVLEKGVDARQYQLLLIRKSVGDQLFSMANNLNYQSLKKRIRMMTTKRSSRWQQLRALTVVPVAGLALMAFAHPEVVTVAEQIEEQAVLPMLAAEMPADTVKGMAQTVVGGKTKKQQDLLYNSHPVIGQLEQKDDTTKIFEVVEQMPKFPGGDAAMMQFLSRTVKYPKDAQEQQKQGRVVVSFVVEKDGSVTEAKILRSVFPSLDEEALRVISAMPKWEPGMQRGKAVRVKYTIPISFKLQGKEKTNPTIIIQEMETAQADPLIFIDGKEATKAMVQALDQSKIESIDVLKEESAVKTYGEKGKNGAIIIRLKK